VCSEPSRNGVVARALDRAAASEAGRLTACSLSPSRVLKVVRSVSTPVLVLRDATSTDGRWLMRPNVRVNPDRGGKACKAGLRRWYLWRGPALQALP
jgi:hypothetical protein